MFAVRRTHWLPPRVYQTAKLAALVSILSAAWHRLDLATANVRPQLPITEAWKILDVKPGTSPGLVKKAYRKRILEVHPDITGDDGVLLQQVHDAYDVLQRVQDPAHWDLQGLDHGLPSWASPLLLGVQWSEDCPNYATFLEKPNNKALAVGEMDENAGVRPWAAVWGKFSQAQANTEALRLCRQHGTGCRLLYGGSSTRARVAPNPQAGKDESEWWNAQFRNSGKTPGFGWIPAINPAEEKIVGHKTLEVKDGEYGILRVPVFREIKKAGMPYYYSPERPRERVYMRKPNFRHLRKIRLKNWKTDPRFRKMHNEMSERDGLL